MLVSSFRIRLRLLTRRADQETRPALRRREVVSNDRIVSAWMLRPRRAKLVKEYPSAIWRLVEVNACAANRTAGVRVDVTGICNKRELKELTVLRGTDGRETSVVTAAGVTATASAARNRRMDGNHVETVMEEFNFFAAVIASRHVYPICFASSELEFTLSVAQGGACFTALALGYFLSGLRPSIAFVRGHRISRFFQTPPSASARQLPRPPGRWERSAHCNRNVR